MKISTVIKRALNRLRDPAFPSAEQEAAVQAVDARLKADRDSSALYSLGRPPPVPLDALGYPWRPKWFPEPGARTAIGPRWGTPEYAAELERQYDAVFNPPIADVYAWVDPWEGR